MKILKWMLDHPGGSQKDCAKATGYSKSHVSRIICSPDYRAKWKQVYDAVMEQIIQEKVMSLGINRHELG